MTSIIICDTLNKVHYKEADSINTIITSKEAILTVCRRLVCESGIESVNMRSVAENCNVSVGSVYNYFPSKADLIAATIQSIWGSIFQMDNHCNDFDSFSQYIVWIFDSVQAGAVEYPNFFTAHSISFANFEKEKARPMMERYFDHIKAGLLRALQMDKNVKQSAFSDDFTMDSFVSFVFSSLISLLANQEPSCITLIEIIKRSIY